ncbi:MAG TPA: peroxiredoxin family protein [Verrucomicrobiae bacterium]
MYDLLLIGSVLALCLAAGCCWLGWQLLRQNGRILLRLEALEQWLDDLELSEPSSSRREEASDQRSEASGQRSKGDQSFSTSSATCNNGHDRESRFGNRSLAGSRLKRDGLKAGAAAPSFRLPRLDGGELSLAALRGQRVLLVFSDPHCGPCNTLAPELQRFYRRDGNNARSRSAPGKGEPTSVVKVVMIARGDPKENRAKVKEHGLTFPVVLQQQWEISRRYAMFATPVAYLIDESGIIAHQVAVGTDAILALMDTTISTHPVTYATVPDTPENPSRTTENRAARRE